MKNRYLALWILFIVGILACDMHYIFGCDSASQEQRLLDTDTTDTARTAPRDVASTEFRRLPRELIFELRSWIFNGLLHDGTPNNHQPTLLELFAAIKRMIALQHPNIWKLNPHFASAINLGEIGNMLAQYAQEQNEIINIPHVGVFNFAHALSRLLSDSILAGPCDADILRVLLQAGVQVNPNELFNAARRHGIDYMTIFFNAHDPIRGNPARKPICIADVDAAGRGFLHHAASANNSDLVYELLQRCVPVDMVDAAGRSALHYAARRGSIESLMLLLHVGHARRTIKDRYGRTPLHMAVRGVLFSIHADDIAANADLQENENIRRITTAQELEQHGMRLRACMRELQAGQDETVCRICQEPLAARASLSLQCDPEIDSMHGFHEDCLAEDYYQKNADCPHCGVRYDVRRLYASEHRNHRFIQAAIWTIGGMATGFAATILAGHTLPLCAELAFASSSCDNALKILLLKHAAGETIPDDIKRAFYIHIWDPASDMSYIARRFPELVKLLQQFSLQDIRMVLQQQAFDDPSLAVDNFNPYLRRVAHQNPSLARRVRFFNMHHAFKDSSAETDWYRAGSDLLMGSALCAFGIPYFGALVSLTFGPGCYRILSTGQKKLDKLTEEYRRKQNGHPYGFIQDISRSKGMLCGLTGVALGCLGALWFMKKSA